MCVCVCMRVYVSCACACTCAHARACLYAMLNICVSAEAVCVFHGDESPSKFIEIKSWLSW